MTAATLGRPIMPDITNLDPQHWPTWVYWAGPALTALTGGGWITQWFKNRGERERRIDDRLTDWTARRDAELAVIHDEMRRDLTALRGEVSQLRERMAAVTAFAIGLHVAATRLAQAVQAGEPASELAEVVLQFEPPAFLRVDP